MHDPWRPSPDEVRHWARTTSNAWADPPCEDWLLALTWARHEKAYLELANDETCPARTFMVQVLYFIVGHAVHHNFDSVPVAVVEGFVRRAGEYNHTDIIRWTKRCRRLLDDPSTFDYDRWCGGQFEQIPLDD